MAAVGETPLGRDSPDGLPQLRQFIAGACQATNSDGFAHGLSSGVERPVDRADRQAMCTSDRARAQMFIKKVLLDEPVDGIAQRRSAPRPSSSSHICLVRLKIAKDAPRLLWLAIYVWTIPAQVVQIHIAISATGASEACRAAAARSASPSSGVYRRNGSARTPSREPIVRRRPQRPSARRHRHPLLTG